jgi:hypothetical protein
VLFNQEIFYFGLSPNSLSLPKHQSTIYLVVMTTTALTHGVLQWKQARQDNNLGQAYGSGVALK